MERQEAVLFTALLRHNLDTDPARRVTQMLIEHARVLLSEGAPADWLLEEMREEQVLVPEIIDHLEAVDLTAKDLIGVTFDGTTYQNFCNVVTTLLETFPTPAKLTAALGPLFEKQDDEATANEQPEQAVEPPAPPPPAPFPAPVALTPDDQPEDAHQQVDGQDNNGANADEADRDVVDVPAPVNVSE